MNGSRTRYPVPQTGFGRLIPSMNLTRRNICRLGALLIGPAYLPSLFGQENKRRDTLHPPEPAGQEFDMLLLPGQKSRNQAFTCLRESRQEFSRCLKQLIDTA